jgi:hypothetical protein
MLNKRYYYQILMKTKFPEQIIKIILNTKFSENPFSGSRFVSCADEQMEQQADRTKLIVAFSNFMGESKNVNNTIFVFYIFCATFRLKYFSLLEEFSDILS